MKQKVSKERKENKCEEVQGINKWRERERKKKQVDFVFRVFIHIASACIGVSGEDKGAKLGVKI